MQKRKMRRVGILSQKGGAGKTTTAINLAIAAIGDGQFPIIIDADPQATASVWRRVRKPDDTPPPVVAQQPTADSLTHYESLGATIALIDCAPAHNIAADSIARLCDLLIIPARPSCLDLAAVHSSAEIAKNAGCRAFFLINSAPTSTDRPEKEMADDLKQFGLPVCPVVIHDRQACRDALATGSGVTEAYPRTKAASETRALWRWLKQELKK